MPPPDLHSTALAAITRTLHRYAYAVDEMDRAMLMDTFTEDGFMDATVAHGDPIPRLAVPSAIADFILAGRASQGDRRRHVVTNTWLENLTDDSATAHSYHMILISTDASMQFKSMGVYKDDMVRCDDGEWRCKAKRIWLDGPY